MSSLADLFVAVVAALLGFFILVMTIGFWDRCLMHSKVKFLQERLGTVAAKIILVLLAIFLFGLATSLTIGMY
ncbi:MAG: hypothetical protein MPJ24_05430 [Pirellulaceae bacterium]|nr:hypothetical protein [Pirellulaceae bacterium]